MARVLNEEEAPTNGARTQTEIEIEEENPPSNDVVSSIVKELTQDADIDCMEKLRSSGTVTMCRVPEEIIQANGGGDFEPKMISIGPYHSKNEALYPMQNLKLQYLNDLLRRNIEKNKVEKYTAAIRDQLLTAKGKYCEFDACGISDAEFLKMLVLDGCFIVEFLLKHAEGLTLALPGIDTDLLSHDMVLIENQCVDMILSNSGVRDLLSASGRIFEEKSPSMKSTIPTAKEENNMGIQFCSNAYVLPYNMFYSDGSISEGSKEINDNFFTEFENMLFYEQINPKKTTEKKQHFNYSFLEKLYQEEMFCNRSSSISTYALYMSHLVKTDTDVDVLTRCGMLKMVTTTHGAKEIAEFFSKRRSWLVLSKEEVHFLSEQFAAINEFCNKSHNKRKAKLKKEYFKNTLIILSFIGFMLILCMTAVQTVLAIVK